MTILEVKQKVATKVNSGLTHKKAIIQLAKELNVNHHTLIKKLENESNEREFKVREYKRKSEKRLKGINNYNDIIIRCVSKNPDNLKLAFKNAVDAIHEKSGKVYSHAYVANYWYDFLCKEEEVFKVVSKHRTLTNTKILQEEAKKPSGIRKIIMTTKSMISAIFS